MCVYTHTHTHTHTHTGGPLYPRFQLTAIYRGPKKAGKVKNKQFISFKTRAKRERAVTRWNPAAQMRPVLDSSPFVPHNHASPQTWHFSASSVLAVRISCRVIALFLFRKPLFTVKMAPKHTSSYAGSASKPKRSHDVLSISEKVKILDMMETEGKKFVRGYCQVVWQERIFYLWSDEEEI